jgi:type IX secretion system PorP/SprF family membrane protein
MKSIYIYILFILSTATMYSQQLSLQSQFMIDKFVINPAFAGTQNGIPINLGVRRQWAGIQEAPVTQYISANLSLGDGIGIGGVIFNEASGPTRRTGISLSGAYQIVLSRYGQNYHELSFGASAIISQHVLDKNKLETFLPDDPTILQAYGSQTLPDANFGVYYHNSDKYFASLSVVNLLQTRVDIYNITNKQKNNFVRNYYLMGGATMEVGNGLKIQPTLLFQSIETLNTQIDVNLRAIFNDKFWLGASYRMQDAFVGMFGINMSSFAFSYSYDFTTSTIKEFSSGSHEVKLGYLIPPSFSNGKSGNKKSF